MAVSLELSFEAHGNPPIKQPMTPCSSPVRDFLGQEDRAESRTTAERGPRQQEQQPENDDEPERIDGPAADPRTNDQGANAAVELEGLSLDIGTFPGGKGAVVEAVSDEEDRMGGQEPPLSYFDDSEEGSQTSSEGSWASFPSSGSNTTHSSAAAGSGEEDDNPPGTAHDNPLPSPEATFRFHEEFGGGGGGFVDGRAEPPPGEGGCMVEDEGGYTLASPEDAGPWSSRAIPKWAFLRSSNSLPVFGLGPEDFHHGGSALRHEVSVDEVEGGG